MISIITTCYNREKYLAQAISSVLNQTFTDFEYIIWDDGSSDNSVAIAESYAISDSRIKVVAAKHQGFVTASINAIALSTGKYFGCVDSDDYLAPTCLEQTKKVLDNDLNIGVVYTWYSEVDALGNFQKIGHRCSIPFSIDRMLTSHIAFHFRLIKREIYNAVGGLDEHYEYASDYDLCLRLSEVTNFYQLPKLLYFYRNHLDNMSNTSKNQQIAYAWQAISKALQRRRLNELHSFQLINN